MKRKFVVINLMNGEYGVAAVSEDTGVDFDLYLKNRSKASAVNTAADLNLMIKLNEKISKNIHVTADCGLHSQSNGK